MATFFADLWESIFTAGPTPTLLLATNASFAALQLLLLALLFATRSVHFGVLSFLTAGLWWAINWFAGEIKAAQEKEEEAQRIRDARKKDKGKGIAGTGDSGGITDAADDEGDDELETEGDGEDLKEEPLKRRPVERDTPVPERPGPEAATSGAQRLETLGEDLVRQRRMGESTSELSTDSEWEKVSENER